MYSKHNTEARRLTIVPCSECVCSLLPSMQCACAGLYCHVWPARFYRIFPTLSQTRHDFREKVIKYKMCVLIFSTTFV